MLSLRVEVTGLQRDCDGTPLYSLLISGREMNGYNEDCLRPASEQEKKDY